MERRGNLPSKGPTPDKPEKLDLTDLKSWTPANSEALAATLRLDHTPEFAAALHSFQPLIEKAKATVFLVPLFQGHLKRSGYGKARDNGQK